MSRGRLIKKVDQDKLKSINVEGYPWTDFSTETILLPDNPRKSVVQSKSHPERELQSKVRTPQEFSKVLSAPVQPILPQDLTAAFLASQEELRQRKRRMQMDEDEAVALELFDLEDSLDEVSHVAGGAQQSSNHPKQTSRDTPDANGGVRTGSPDISDLSAFSGEQKLKIDEDQFEFEAQSDVLPDLQEQLTAAFERGFQQGRVEGEKFAQESAVQRQQQDLQIENVTPDSSQVAEHRTYEDGVAQGQVDAREAAHAEAAEKFNRSVQLFTSALTELQHLKGELISTGREIFAEIVQICAAKVLRNAVQINDDALRKIYESATSQFSLDSKLHIEMHPDDLARLEPHIAASDKERIALVPNDKIAIGDLKIEANNEVISLDIHNTVQQIIDTLKDDLFESSKKDDSDEKAG